MTIIELGEVTTSPAPGGAPRPLRLGDLRWVVAAAVAVATVLLLGGSAVPDQRTMRELWRLPTEMGPFTLVDDRIYLHAFSGTDPGVSAYDAQTGRLIWRFPTDQPPHWLNLDADGLLLLPFEKMQPDGTTSIYETIALDADTGKERWRHRGDVAAIRGDSALLAERSPAGEMTSRLHRVRLSDGATEWTVTPPHPVNAFETLGDRPEQPDNLLTVGADGRVEVRALTDGKLLRSGTIPWLRSNHEQDSYAYLTTFGDLFFTVRVADGRMNVGGFDIRTLRETWTWDGISQSGVFPCGTLLCVGADPEGIQALDPHDGKVRWTSKGWDYGNVLGGDPRRMYVESHRGFGQGLVDPATGAWLARFPNGTVVTDHHTGRLLVLALTKEVPTRLAVHELRGNELVLRGALAQPGDPGCQLSAGRLACIMTLAADRQELVVTDVG